MDLSNAFLPVRLTTLFTSVSAPIRQNCDPAIRASTIEPCISKYHTQSRGAPFYSSRIKL